MAKSMRCKREKRLRAIKRDLVQPFYDKKEEAKLAAIEAALSAPKLPVKASPFASASSSSAMDVNIVSNSNNMDVEMIEGGKAKEFLKPVGKKLKKKLKLARNKRHVKGKGKFKRRHI
uniref:Uncharacterized protein LOC101296935 n=1 Tax=Rhizophora mucronata TaxID=61149 RepID=A0A2P2QVA4_RHIMU